MRACGFETWLPRVSDQLVNLKSGAVHVLDFVMTGLALRLSQPNRVVVGLSHRRLSTLGLDVYPISKTNAVDHLDKVRFYRSIE